MLQDNEIPDYRLFLTINPSYRYDSFAITDILTTRCQFEAECLPRIPKVVVLGPYYNRDKIEESLRDLADGNDSARAIVVYLDDGNTRLLAVEIEDGDCKSIELIDSAAINCGLSSAERDEVLTKLLPLPIKPREFTGPYAHRKASIHDCPVYMIEDAVYRFYTRPLMEASDIRRMHAHICARYDRSSAIQMSDFQKGLTASDQQNIEVTYFDGAVDMWSQEVIPVWDRTPGIWSIVNGAVRRLMDDVNESTTINLLYCYTRYDQYVIMNLRVEEEAARSIDSMKGVVVVPATFIDYPKRNNPDSYIEVSNWINSNISKDGCKYKLLMPILYTQHSIGLMMIVDNAVVQHAVLIDSSGAIEKIPRYKKTVEDFIRRIFVAHGSKEAYITWQQGYAQTGPSCTVYTVENLIRAAKGKTTILSYGRCQALIRAYHARLIRKAAFNLPTRVGKNGKSVNAYKFFIDIQCSRHFNASKRVKPIEVSVNHNPASSKRSHLWDHPSYGVFVDEASVPYVNLDSDDRTTAVLLVAAALDGVQALPVLCDWISKSKLDIPIIDSQAVLAGLKDISDGSYRLTSFMHKHDTFLKFLLLPLVKTHFKDSDASDDSVRIQLVADMGASDVFLLAWKTIRTDQWLAEYVMELYSQDIHASKWRDLLQQTAPHKVKKWAGSDFISDDLVTVPHLRYKRPRRDSDTEEETGLYPNNRSTRTKYTPLKRPIIERTNIIM